jgi:hypothetical protein
MGNAEDYAEEAGGCAKVWLCSPVGHRPRARLGGELEIMAPIWWWSNGRRPCTPSRASSKQCPSTLRLLQGSAEQIDLRSWCAYGNRSGAVRSPATVHFDPRTVRPRSPRTDILRSPCIVEADRFTSPQLQGRGLARRAPTPLAAAAFVPCDRGSARSSYMRRRGSAVSHRVVDLVRRHHTVVLVGPGSCALCSYTCVQILIGHYDAWSPLGRQTWTRPRMHAVPCFCCACVLV